jgi:hypothetical protein
VLVPHDDAVKVEGASVGEKWAVISTRSRAQQTLVVHALPAGGAMPAELGQGSKVVFDEPAYTLSGGGWVDWGSRSGGGAFHTRLQIYIHASGVVVVGKVQEEGNERDSELL